LPSEKPHIKYIYSAKTDFDQLIYQIGGIIGLWFGSSAPLLINSFIGLWKRINSLRIVREFSMHFIKTKKVDTMEMNKYSQQSLIRSNLMRRKNRCRNTV